MLSIENNGLLSINGHGKLIVRAGATLCISPGAKLELQQGFQNIEIEPGAVIPAGCVDPAADYGIQVSPVPASTNITFEYVLPDGINSAELIILDAQGRIVDRVRLNGKRGKKTLDTQSYASGIYLYRSVKSEKLSGKFIIQY